MNVSKEQKCPDEIGETGQWSKELQIQLHKGKNI